MKICVAYVRTKDGTEAVLRGTPEAVSRSIAHGMEQAGGGEILSQVQDEVLSLEAENELWLWFIGDTAKVRLASVAKEKHEIWKRKADFLWDPSHWSFAMDDTVCFFMRNHDDMILQAPKPGSPATKPKTLN